MAGDYWSRHHTSLRTFLALVIKELHPETMVSEDYEKALDRLHRGDEQQARNWREPPRTFATCLECLGEGSVQNPAWYDDDECHDPEALDCETCRGRGLVEIIDKPEPAPIEDDFPF